jgi:hypothetical protein
MVRRRRLTTRAAEGFASRVAAPEFGEDFKRRQRETSKPDRNQERIANYIDSPALNFPGRCSLKATKRGTERAP